MQVKHLVGHVVNKALIDPDAGIDFVMSDETEDRTGDIIKSDAWQLANFKKNPICLMGHDHDDPIGVWDNVRIVGKQLIGTLKLAAEGTSSEIDTLRELLKQKILKAVSVGFLPLEYTEVEKTRSYVYTKVELLECSLVSVPANQNALIIARSFGANEKRIFAAEQLLTRSQKVAISRAALAVKSVDNLMKRE